MNRCLTAPHRRKHRLAFIHPTRNYDEPQVHGSTFAMIPLEDEVCIPGGDAYTYYYGDLPESGTDKLTGTGQIAPCHSPCLSTLRVNHHDHKKTTQSLPKQLDRSTIVGLFGQRRHDTATSDQIGDDRIGTSLLPC